jgi:hypothetical protein
MEEEIFIIEENTQITNNLDVVETVSIYRKVDFDLCSENMINILTNN